MSETQTSWTIPISLRPVAIDPKRTKHFHVLNLGAGVQSTTLYLLANAKKLLDSGSVPIQFDCAIFADTGEEPSDEGESVLKHLEWLKQQGGIPILTGTAGKLGDHLLNGTTVGRFASIPAYTLLPDGKIGAVRRQCTKEYKIDVIQRVIRKQVLNLKPRQRVPSNVLVHQYVGISLDEVGRMLRMQKRQRENPIQWSHFRFPLIEQFGWTREQCREFLKPRIPHRVPRSACTFCPFHSNEEWARIKARNGNDWKRVVEIDRALRQPGTVLNRNIKAQMFLHKSCKPIDEIDFGTAPSEREMAGECEGMCGN